jgi:very-short-patch-repair endonuclease
MRADRALERLGGVADTATLLRSTSRSRLRRAVRRGWVVRDTRGRYALPGVDDALRRASALSGVLVEDSAAQYHGWELKHRPAKPRVAVPRNRNVDPSRRRGVMVRYVDLPAEDVSRLATVPGATVMACAARMPFDEALAVADSALRHRDVSRAELLRRAEAMPDRYRSRCLRVAAQADGRAANPFESVLRCLAIEEGLDVVPQHPVAAGGLVLHPDLVDVRRRLVLEADSWTWHANRDAHDRDCWRYNALVLAGWTVLRFTWDQVMRRPARVRAALRSVAVSAA